MIFTNPSGKRGAVSASKKNCATTKASASDNLQQLQGGIVSILISSISSNTSPHFSQYSCNPSSFDSEELLSAVTTKEQRCLRNKEIINSIFN